MAVMKASFLNQSVEEFIKKIMVPVLERITQDLTHKEQRNFRKEVLNRRGRVNHFYRFFTAHFLLEHENTLRDASNDLPNFNFDELLKYLTLPHNLGYKLLNHIDRLDYILRDMFHVGYIRVDLNLPFYFSNLELKSEKQIEMPSEWEVLDKLESYAKQNIYNDKRVKIAESLYQKIFKKAILDSKIGLANLLEWNDQELVNTLREYQERKEQKYRLKAEIDRIKPNLESIPTYTFSVSSKRSTSRNLLLIEGRVKTIGNYLVNELNRSFENGIFKGAYLDSFSTTSDINGTMACLDRKHIRRFLQETARYEKYYQKHNLEQLGKCIWGKETKINFDRYKPVVQELLKQMEKDRDIDPLEIFCKGISISEKRLPGTINLSEIKETAENLFRLIYEMGKYRNKSDFVKDSLIETFLRNPNRIIGDENRLQDFNFPTKNDLLSYMEQFSGKGRRKIKGFKGKAHEYHTYLVKICESSEDKKEIKKWVFPSTSTPRGEVDVWVLHVFKRRRPLLELIECSISKSETKKLEAIRKLKQIVNHLESRFVSKLETKLFFNDEELNP